MANRIKAKLIMQLSAEGMLGRQIAASQHISRNSVSKVRQAANENNIVWEDIQELTEHEVYERLFQKRPKLIMHIPILTGSKFIKSLRVMV